MWLSKSRPMAKKKIVEPIQVKERPEPEGRGDWLYSCTSCGYQRKDSVSFNQPCPKCGGHGWLCHWLIKPQPTIKKSDNEASDQNNSNDRRCRKTLAPPIKRQADIMLPLNRKPFVAKRGSSRGLNPVLGRREIILPTDLIKRFADQGLGCKTIAIKLQDQGITVSHMTIQRRLQSKTGGNNVKNRKN